MAKLSEAHRDELCAEIMRLFSKDWTQIDLTAAQLRAGVGLFDDEMEDTEARILAAVPAWAYDWLVSNPILSRYILEQVAQKRREEL